MGIAMVNDNPYQLANAVVSKNEREGLRVSTRLRCGHVAVNHSEFVYYAPIAARRQSGNATCGDTLQVGLDGAGNWTLDEFFVRKCINMPYRAYVGNFSEDSGSWYNPFSWF